MKSNIRKCDRKGILEQIFDSRWKSSDTKKLLQAKCDSEMINFIMGNLGKVIEKATQRINVPEISFKQRKLTSEHFVVGSQGKICSKIPSRRESSHLKGLPLRTGESGVTMRIPTVKKVNLSLSSSPSVDNLQHHFFRLSMVAETAIDLAGANEQKGKVRLSVAREVEQSRQGYRLKEAFLLCTYSSQ